MNIITSVTSINKQIHTSGQQSSDENWHYNKIPGTLTNCRSEPIKEFSQGFVHNTFALAAGHGFCPRRRREWLLPLENKKRTVRYFIASNLDFDVSWGFQEVESKVEKIQQDSLYLTLSPSVKFQIMSRKVYLR